MDNNMDRLSEKISAQDIIRANARAEAAEAERTRQEAEHYKAQLEELKETARHQSLAIDETRKSLASLSERMDESDTKIHDVGVQVYRNVQAVIEKNQAANNDELRQLREYTQEAFEELKKRNEDDFKELSDMNASAFQSMKDTNADQFKETGRNLEQLLVGVETKNGAVLPLLIITMLIAAADLVVNILRILGVF